LYPLKTGNTKTDEGEETMNGFYGRILIVDLTEKTFSVQNLADEIYTAYLGGKGLASYLLYHHNPPGVDPLDPETRLIFATGPITGSLIWGSSRYGVFTKSPQTGLYSESYSGGRVPEAIDATGFDAVILHGRSSQPTVLVVHPEGVEFHAAGDLWGQDTIVTEKQVNKRFADTTRGHKKSGAVVIGPAGENLVRFAVIENDYWRSAGRTGVGTVMGAKKVKAILFHGDRRRSLFDESAVKAFSKSFMKVNKDSPAANAYRSMGTTMMVKLVNEAGAFPTRYWRSGQYQDWKKISADALHQRCQVTPKACAKCFMACGRMTKVLEGKHAGLEVEGPEYETIYAFGGLCEIDRIEEIAHLNDICDRLGMDTISAGNLCAFSIEAARNGRIDRPLDYGDADAVAALLEDIAYRRDIGEVLAEGIRPAAKNWDMEEEAIHVKGLEPAGYDPRVLKGMGLAFATSDRGACHLRATFYKPELSGMIEPEQIEGKAEMFIDFEDRLTLFDALILCRFYRDFYPWDELGKLVLMTTGIKTDQPALQNIAAEILALARKFNLREGMRPEDDWLPARFFRSRLEDSGASLQEAEFFTLLKDYYRLRGWQEDGRL